MKITTLYLTTPYRSPQNPDPTWCTNILLLPFTRPWPYLGGEATGLGNELNMGHEERSAWNDLFLPCSIWEGISDISACCCNKQAIKKAQIQQKLVCSHNSTTCVFLLQSDFPLRDPGPHLRPCHRRDSYNLYANCGGRKTVEKAWAHTCRSRDDTWYLHLCSTAKGQPGGHI